MERQIEAGIGINGRVMIGVVRFRTVGGYVPVALDVVPRLFAVRQPGGSGRSLEWGAQDDFVVRKALIPEFSAGGNHAVISIHVNGRPVVLEGEVVHILHVRGGEPVGDGMQGDGKEHVRIRLPDGLGQLPVVGPLSIPLVQPFKVQVHAVQRIFFQQVPDAVRKPLAGGGSRQHGAPRASGNAQADAHASHPFRHAAQRADMFRPGGGITAEDVAVPPVSHDETVIPVGLYFRAQTVDGPGQMPHAHVVYFPLQVPAHDGIRRAVHFPGGDRCRLQGGTVDVKDARPRRGIADEGQPEVFMKGYGGQVRLPGSRGARLQARLVMAVRPRQRHGHAVVFKQGDVLLPGG